MTPPSLPRPLLIVLAVLFGAATTFYSGLWIFYGNRGVPVELGFDNKYLLNSRCELVQSILAGGPAERAGLKPGDCIVAINGSPLERDDSLPRVWAQHRPGDSIELTVRRAEVHNPIELHAIFRASSASSAGVGMAEELGQSIRRLFPVAFLIVGLAVLFFRLESRDAWLLALMFAGFIAIPGFASSYLGVPPTLRPMAVAYRAIFNNIAAALFYFFFAVFPARSPLDRRLPWLKWTALGLGPVWALPTLRSVTTNQTASLEWLSAGFGHVLVLLFNYGLVLLGFLSLSWNAWSLTSTEAQRKVRVILGGTLVGVAPATLVLAAVDFFSLRLSLWLAATTIVLLWLFPLSFAYAVVKHRVLEIPVLLRRSARYLLVQRGFRVLLVILSVGVTLAFALLFAGYLQHLTEAAVPGGIALGTMFGTLLLWSGTRVHKDVGKRIDRAFFRNAYDAHIILEDLLEKTRTVSDRNEMAALLENQLLRALQPSSLVVYLEGSDDQLLAVAGEVPPDARTIFNTHSAFAKLARRGKPWEVSGESLADVPAPLNFALKPDCLVPILGRDSRLAGLVVLGSRLSEEPYSREDKQLLASVASQAGVALESIRLAEKIAERIDAENRARQEMEFARQVQTRLFPQKLPAMQTLEYTGRCVPARTVGGDYYDFLELRPGRLALVLADIAGKGVPGALLMANLQANLRSQYAAAVDDLPGLLASVNRLFFQTTDTSSYATLFFADYDDATHRLRYANCGHLPALLLRCGETAQAERLPSTCTVLGLFERWQCQVAEITIAPGDTLALYTDGVTEAANGADEEFGEARLLETLRRYRQLPVDQLIEALAGAVQKFSDGQQQDDITLVVAHCRA
jgi:sigma-B regulation protein RsbU (phosphoserine phosphatase)